MMKKSVVALAVAGALAVPASASAMEVAGKMLEVYGKVHMSLDSVKADGPPATGDVSNLSLASNSSRLGFKGKYGLSDDLTALWQIESKVVYDAGGKSKFAGRNTFFGLAGSFGTVKLGYHDTAFKDIRGKYFDVFGDTAADARDIMGTSSDHAYSEDIRADNMIMYTSPRVNGLQFNVQYSTSWDSTTEQGQDNNDHSATSASVTYEGGNLKAGLAYQVGKNGKNVSDAKGTRLGVKYKLSPVVIGLMYEDLKGGADFPTLTRKAYGVNATFKMDKNNALKVQYVKGKATDVGNDGAKQTSIGIDHKLASHTNVYALYTQLKNDPNANYRIKGGHDTDVYTTVDGGKINVISLGVVYKF